MRGTPIYLVFLMMCIFASKTPKVLVIGIDGCRSDALIKANTPNIDFLIQQSVHSYNATITMPTYSATGWATICTGTFHDKHNVMDNSFKGRNFTAYPHWFKYIFNNFTTASIVQWKGVQEYIVQDSLPCADINLSGDSDFVTKSAVSVLTVPDPNSNSEPKPDVDVLFLHYDDVDSEGHATGFSNENPFYMNAIEAVDVKIGLVISAVLDRPSFANEDWLVIVTTDHGGRTTEHGRPSPMERGVFWIASYLGAAHSIELGNVVATSDPENGIQFDPTVDEASVSISGAEDLPTRDFTIEVRLWLDDWDGEPAVIATNKASNPQSPGWGIYLSQEGHWKFVISDGQASRELIGGWLDASKWSHIAATVDFSNDPARVIIYDDAVVVDVANLTDFKEIRSESLSFGQDGVLMSQDIFPGVLGEVRIWKNVINRDTLRRYSCRSIDLIHPYLSSLWGLWIFDEDTIASGVVKDWSLHGRDGTVNGNATRVSSSILPTCVVSIIPGHVDVVPTALSHLGVSVRPEWKLDGVPILEGAKLRRVKITN